MPGTVQELLPSSPSAPRSERGELPPLRARGVGEMLDVALDVLRERLATCALLSFCLWVPAQALDMQLGDLGENFEFALLSLPLTLFVQSLTIALVTRVVYGQLQGRPISALGASTAVLKRAPALLVNTLLQPLAIFCAMMCLILPGLYLSFLWSCAAAALVLEDLGPFRALARSARLVRGSFWRWGNMVSVLLFLNLPFTSVGAALKDANVRSWLLPHSGLPEPAFDAALILVVSLFLGLATAINGVVFTVFYLDNRVRREGLDIAMRLERLSDRAGGRDAGDPGSLLPRERASR
jgi:hypothetical protein